MKSDRPTLWFSLYYWFNADGSARWIEIRRGQDLVRIQQHRRTLKSNGYCTALAARRF